MNTLLLNRNFEMPTDGWYHVLPLGEYPHPEGVTQVFDREGATRMVNRFNEQKRARNFPGLLIDFDHFSHEPDKSSEAAGWATELQNREDGVWAQIRWSDSGEAAVKGGRYRLISPVVDQSEVLANSAKKKVRPTRLLRLALTNDPNLKGMVPLSNRSVPDGTSDKSGTTNERKTMKSVSTLLGLSPDASEEAVHAEVLKLKNRADITPDALTVLKNRNATLETENKALQTTRIDQALITYKNRFKPEVKDSIKALLEGNYDNAIKFLEGCPEIGKPPGGQLHNRAGARTPNGDALKNRSTTTTSGDDADPEATEAKAQKLRNRAGQIFASNRAAGWDAAWDEANRELAATN